jgi:peptidoglycan/LPS O-acetylase OafA/YrhL
MFDSLLFAGLNIGKFRASMRKYADMNMDTSTTYASRCQNLRGAEGNVIGSLTQILYIVSGNYGDWTRSPSSVFVAGLSLMVFLLFRDPCEKRYSPRGVVVFASSYSFCIYVLYPIFLNVAYKALGLGPWSMPPVLFELCMWLLAFFGSAVTVWVMQRVPGIRRIL